MSEYSFVFPSEVQRYRAVKKLFRFGDRTFSTFDAAVQYSRSTPSYFSHLALEIYAEDVATKQFVLVGQLTKEELGNLGRVLRNLSIVRQVLRDEVEHKGSESTTV